MRPILSTKHGLFGKAKFATLTIAALSLLVTLVGSGAQTVGASTATGDSDTEVLPHGVTYQDEATSLLHDASLVAAATGVDPDSMQSALRFRDEFDSIVIDVIADYPDQVSAAWADSIPATSGTLAFVGDVPSAVEQEVSRSGLDIVVLSGWEISMFEHKLRSEEAARALVAAGFVNFETYYDPPSNQLVVNLLTGSAATAFTSEDVYNIISRHFADSPETLVGRAAAVEPSDIRVSVEERDGPFVELTHTRGGNWLRDDGVNECTSGWSVSGAGTTGVLTAGHCTGLNQFVQPGVAPYGMTFQAQEYFNGSRGDVEWHTTTHVELAEFYANATTIRSVTSFEYTHTMTGDPVCFYGRASNDRECNLVVAAVNLTVVDDNGNTIHDLARSNAYAGDIGGDSGGGWSFGNRAYGVQHGHTSSASYFTPIDVAEQELNVSILLN